MVIYSQKWELSKLKYFLNILSVSHMRFCLLVIAVSTHRVKLISFFPSWPDSYWKIVQGFFDSLLFQWLFIYTLWIQIFTAPFKRTKPRPHTALLMCLKRYSALGISAIRNYAMFKWLFLFMKWGKILNHCTFHG